jgi:KipI family sensor histidine kinase inhibitor
MQGRPIDQRRSAAGPKKGALMLECKSPEGGSPIYRALPAGDTAVVIEFGDTVDRKLSAWVLALAHRLNEQEVVGVIEIVPSFRSLLVYYDPVVLPVASLIAHIDRMIAGVHGHEGSGRSVRLPVCYDASVAPDLHEVARRTGLSPAQVIEQHSAVTYHVYMLGFLPGQAYMGDLAVERSLPRREPTVKDPGRIARHCRKNDLHLSVRYSLRLACHRTLSRGLVEAQTPAVRNPCSRRQGYLCAGVTARIRGSFGEGGQW